MPLIGIMRKLCFVVCSALSSIALGGLGLRAGGAVGSASKKGTQRA